MHARTALPAILLALAAFTAACSSNSSTKASPTACKEALTEQLRDATANGKKGSRPAACEGLDNKTLEDLVGEVTTEWLASDDADKAVTDSLEDVWGEGIPVPEVTESEPTAPQISGDCRAWIQDELLDSSDSIDTTPGYNACGNLADEQLDQAVEDVTNELIEQGATPAS